MFYNYLDTFNYSAEKYIGNGPGFNGNLGKKPIPDVPLAIAQINHPRGLSADYLGNLYFADEYNGSVRVVTKDDSGAWVVRTIVGTGVEAGSAEPPNGVIAQGIEMYEPMGVDVSDYCRYVVFLDTDSHLVMLLDMEHPAGIYEKDIYYKGSLLYAAGTPYPAGPWLTTVAGEYISGSAGGYYQPPDNDAMKARFHNPQGVVITKDANTIYVADTENNVIRKLNIVVDNKWEITRFAGSPTAAAGYGGDGGNALSALLNHPVGIALDDAEENLYIADMNNHRIRKIELATNVITTVAGNGSIPPSQYTNVNDGTVAEHGKPLNQVALFKYPSDVALDANNNIYVADQSHNRIRKILADLSEIRTIYGNGGTLIQAPRGITLNWEGKVFASDTEGAKIWLLTPEGMTCENTPPAPLCKGNGVDIIPVATKQASGAGLEDGQFELGLFSDETPIDTAFNDENGDVSFAPITFTEPGVYEYAIRELTQSGSGWTTDPHIYRVIVTVTDQDGELVAEVSYPDGTPDFMNTYEPKPTKACLVAKKETVGAELEAGMFSFVLSEEDGTPIETIQNDGNGDVNFAAITYTEAGVYRYTIREILTPIAGWKLDDTVYEVVVTVTDEDGELVAHVSYQGGSAPTFVNEYEPKSVEVVLTAKKETVGAALEAGMFEFNLLRQDGTLIETIQNDGDGDVHFTAISYTAVGVHHYKIHEVLTPKAGWTLDDTLYDVTVTITDEDGELVAHVSHPGGTPEFTNTYEPEPVQVTFNAKKEALGKALADGQFEFGLFENGGSRIAAATNDASGTITFSPVTFTEVGKYHYTIRELTPSGGGWQTDSTVYPAIVTVTNKEGVLTAEVTYPKSNPVFLNKYTDKTAKVRLLGKKVVCGGCLERAQFTFSVYDQNGNLLLEAHNDRHGNIVFPELVFEQPGIYQYTMRETASTDCYWIMDEKHYPIVIAVEDHGINKLIATINYPAGLPVFLNQFAPWKCCCDPKHRPEGSKVTCLEPRQKEC